MKKGFTLAEVLITLAVIGVVAVLTVPNMMKSYQKQVAVTQLQKFYNQLRTAATNCMQEEMSDSLIGTTADTDPQTFIKKYLKATSFFEDSAEGFGETYQKLDGQNYTITQCTERGAAKPPKPPKIFRNVCTTLETGLSLIVATNKSMSTIEQEIQEEKGPENHGFIELYVDVNGKKGPNVIGRDCFLVNLYSDGTVGSSYMKDPERDYKSWCSNDSQYGPMHCFDYIKYNNWTMDY